MTDIKVKGYDQVLDPRLGRIVEHDERSKQFPYKPRTAKQPVSVRWTRIVPTFDQGNTGSCTGNAGTGCLGTAPFYALIKDILVQKNLELNENEAVAVYSAATAIDEYPGTYPPDDTGSSGLAVAKVLQGLGLISGYTHAFDFDTLLQALQDHPVIVGTNWYEGMFNPDANGVISISGQVAGGHEYIIDEVDISRQMLGIQNSWGTSWGLNGRAYISFADFRRLLSEDGDITIFVPITQPAPSPVVPTPSPEPIPTPVEDADATLWAAVKDWAHGRHVGKTRIVQNAILTWAKSKGYTK